MTNSQVYLTGSPMTCSQSEEKYPGDAYYSYFYSSKEEEKNRL